MARPKTLKRRFPALTGALVGCALLVYACPRLAELLVYDRTAILGGALWRLWTGSCVHFSGSHLLWDLLVLAPAGAMLEVCATRRYWLVCTLAVLVPGPVLLLTDPELGRYGGLSGVAIAAVAYLCLRQAREPGPLRKVWLAMLGIAALKIAAEFVTGASFFASAAETPFRTVPVSHLIGLISALMVFWRDRRSSAEMRGRPPGARPKVPALLTGTAAPSTRD